MILKITGVLLALFFTSPLVANEQGQFNLEELKEKCRQLSANTQLQPFSVEVTCREKSYQWKEANPAAISLSNLREVGGALRVKNFSVAYHGESAPIADSTAFCTIMERWEVTVPAVDVELSCAELYEIEDMTSFCTPIIDERVKEDPSIVTEVQTEHLYNTCKGQTQLNE